MKAGMKACETKAHQRVRKPPDNFVAELASRQLVFGGTEKRLIESLTIASVERWINRRDGVAMADLPERHGTIVCDDSRVAALDTKRLIAANKT